MRVSPWAASTAIAAAAAVAFGVSAAGQGPAGQAPGGARAGGGGRGGGNPTAAALFTVADINKDGTVTRGELMVTVEKWYGDADTAKAGSITPEQLGATLTTALPAPAPPAGGGGRGPVTCGGNSATKTPCPDHVAAMTAALPAKAPAKPAKARKILVLGNAQGFVHSSIPLAGAMVEALGNKLKTWTTKITYDPADINTANLKQYDLVFLSSTTGCFLDAVPGQPVPSKAEIDARRAALLEFVRSGKGIAGVHAATDSYHNNCPTNAPPAEGARGARGAGGRGGGRGAATPGGQLATQIVTAADKNTDQKLTVIELDAMANAWFDAMDSGKTGRIAQADFPARFASLTPAPPPPPVVARGSVKQPAEGSWPEFNKMIGGYFKYHWNDGTLIPVKVDDTKSPLTKMFAGPFEIVDETYTFAQDSFSRENVHVLTSIDYAKMPEATRMQEPAGTARSDGDYALSYIRREGKGRMFYEAHGHNEKIYAIPAMVEHMLAGIQYALGDLKADDSPSVKAKK